MVIRQKNQQELTMALTAHEEKTLTDIKVKLKVMGQVSILEKDISTLEKKIEIKQKKLSELINILDGNSTANKKSSEKSKKENGKPEDPSDLLFEG